MYECPHNATGSRGEASLRNRDCATPLWHAKAVTKSIAAAEVHTSADVKFDIRLMAWR